MMAERGNAGLWGVTPKWRFRPMDEAAAAAMAHVAGVTP